jgi:hypothetical protein
LAVLQIAVAHQIRLDRFHPTGSHPQLLSSSMATLGCSLLVCTCSCAAASLLLVLVSC